LVPLDEVLRHKLWQQTLCYVMAVRGQKHKTAPITLCMWDLSVAIRYTYACTVIGEVPNKTHCAGFLLYSWCRYSFYYKQHTCCYYQCHGSSLLRYTLFVFVSFLAQATICIELFTYEGESIIIRTVCLISIKKTRAEILQPHNFSTQSPCFTMHFVHHRTICFMTSE